MSGRRTGSRDGGGDTDDDRQGDSVDRRSQFQGKTALGIMKLDALSTE